ncbi:hypothetical protein QBC41DRAFT_308523 [Cercophora samala]|uniref:C2H2-type domain-containing protein n=1 Tax=Cercophora samala TaxID=330535 RepID=A0AA40CWK7_9PEZI|nr:hypothetical protein QBC41DRAFT_308523 [Cercophora samala]
MSGTKRPYDSFLETSNNADIQQMHEPLLADRLEGLDKESARASSTQPGECRRYPTRNIPPSAYFSLRPMPNPSTPSLSASSPKHFVSPSSEKANIKHRKIKKTRTFVFPKSKIDQALYRSWKDGSTGQVLKTCGALIPEAYGKSDDPDFPWICPIRSCRMMFETLSSLGTHFVNRHRATKLNDNLDGTLTDLGKYAGRENGKGIKKDGVPKPGIVISKKRLSRQLYPLASPTRFLKSQSSGQQSTPVAIDASSGPAIEHATSERRYNTWPDESRELMTMQGALLPEGYQHDHSLPGRPWIRHYGCHLNDNLDGTFTLVPQKDNPQGLEESELKLRPATVVSQVPSNAEAVTHQASHLLTPPDQSGLKAPLGEHSVALWEYICAHFHGVLINRSYKKRPAIRYLLGLPRLRDLHFDLPGMHSLTVGQLAALLIQVTGQRVEDECQRCRHGDGPFDLCVHHSPDKEKAVSTGSNKQSAACAGCLFHGVGSLCSIKRSKRQQFQPEIEPSTVAPLPEIPDVVLTPTSNRRSRKLSLLQEDTTGERRSPRFIDSSSKTREVSKTLKTPKSLKLKAQKTPSKLKTPSKPKVPAKKAASTPVSKATSTPKTPKRKTLNRSPSLNLPHTPTRRSGVLPRHILTLKLPPRFNPSPPAAEQSQSILDPEELQLEHWEEETGPRKITSSHGTASMPLAYAGSQFTATSNNQVTQVTSNISVAAIRIQSGAAHHLKADESATRICTLANGKLRVKLDDEEEYSIGARGVFKIDAGLECRVFNRCYEDVVLHVNGFRSL